MRNSILVVIGAVALGGCSKGGGDHFSILGYQPGMDVDAVKTVAQRRDPASHVEETTLKNPFDGRPYVQKLTISNKDGFVTVAFLSGSKLAASVSRSRVYMFGEDGSTTDQVWTALEESYGKKYASSFDRADRAWTKDQAGAITSNPTALSCIAFKGAEPGDVIAFMKARFVRSVTPGCPETYNVHIGFDQVTHAVTRLDQTVINIPALAENGRKIAKAKRDGTIHPVDINVALRGKPDL